jgi:3',5'-cyclic AMP phosphodiesterase CpdA
VTPTLIAQLSDPHLRMADPVTHTALEAAVARVLALRPLPAAVLLTGDIADSGSAEEYELAARLLSPLTMPVHQVAGNHDRFNERTRFAEVAGGVRLVGFDTSIAGRDDGVVELDWLADTLAEDRVTPTIVAMHHPPMVTGLPWLDALGVPADQVRALGDLLSSSPNVRRVVAGHVHKVIHDVLGGCGVITCASTNIAAGLDFVTPDAVLVREPPSILVHALLDGQIVTHVQPV